MIDLNTPLVVWERMAANPLPTDRYEGSAVECLACARGGRLCEECLEDMSHTSPLDPNVQADMPQSILWAEIRHTRGDIARLSDQIGKTAEAITKTTDDHEKRLRDIEKRMWWLAGFFGALQVLSRYFPPPHA